MANETTRMLLDNVETDCPSMASFSISPETHSPEASGSRHVSESPVEHDIPLCSDCASKLATTKGFREGNIASHCACCELIANALPFNNSRTAANGIRRKSLKWGYCDSSFVSIRSIQGRLHGEVHFNAHHQHRPLDIPEVIDFQGPRAWLARCEKVHGAQCGQRSLPERYSNPINIILVDVLHDCLVKKTTASRYFALSYVWGRAVTIKTTNQNFSIFQQNGALGGTATLPTTVSDAMLLTREMGEQYLWVDCLCIVQDSPTMYSDIVNMDAIFARAELTIITTCGNNANVALAGVRPNTRRRRTMSKQQDCSLLTLYLPTSKLGLLDGTTYASRAWTFQELLFAKRILFVSSQQIVFHCSHSRRSESIPMERSHNTQFGSGRIKLYPELNSTMSNFEMLETYTAMVEEYSEKDLSFQSDIENAFAGLASVLESWHRGSPVFHGYMSSFFAWSMMWMFEVGSYVSSSEPEIERGRREEFPTWSWVAWPAIISPLGQSIISAPVLSKIRNVDITLFNKQKMSHSWDLEDKTSTETYVASSRQQIHIKLNPVDSNTSHGPLSILAFDAEHTYWTEFSIQSPRRYMEGLIFGIPGVTQCCGVLSVFPDSETKLQALMSSLSMESTQHMGQDWTLVRLYQFQLQPWDADLDSLQYNLDRMYHEEDPSTSRQREIRAPFEQRDLLFVLLVRRKGSFWERMGSGIMIEEYWPLTDAPGSFRSYQERFVLI
ncbi:heterokaryon incompatibility protein-domain-containing protein [Paraphoma chrysanthemicola]|nr:heterokaryon incompatibility protein-domain-containing protein [Paraphoma chrysanthemicola]